MAFFKRLSEAWKRAGDMAAAQNAGSTVQASPRPSYSLATVDSSLSFAFAKYSLGEITLQDYRSQIDEAADWVAEQRRKIIDRNENKYLPEDIQEEILQELDQAEHSVDWRKRWVDDKIYKESISVDGFPDSGTWARFSYIDSEGNVSSRDISNWERRGPYIVGFDRSRQAERTFRQDRISEWKCG